MEKQTEKREVKTAVIAAGGFGTRFMPATKSIPKEMFPLGNKPVVLHVVEEVVKSGISQIIFIVSHHKQSVESFFSPNQILEDYFLKQGKKEIVEDMQRICSMADIGYVYTKPPYGNGGALASAKHLLRKKHPFVFIWADEIIMSPEKPRIKQCLEAYDTYQLPVVSAVEIKDREKRKRYGMAELRDLPESHESIKEIVRIAEKPEPGTEPSPFAAHGAYVLRPDFFDYLEKTEPGKNGELWLTDVINNMMKAGEKFLAKIIQNGIYLDCGDPQEYLRSQIDYTINFTDNAEDLKKFMKSRI